MSADKIRRGFFSGGVASSSDVVFFFAGYRETRWSGGMVVMELF
jgi:hypothetical protein